MIVRHAYFLCAEVVVIFVYCDLDLIHSTSTNRILPLLPVPHQMEEPSARMPSSQQALMAQHRPLSVVQILDTT